MVLFKFSLGVTAVTLRHPLSPSKQQPVQLNAASVCAFSDGCWTLGEAEMSTGSPPTRNLKPLIFGKASNHTVSVQAIKTKR